MTRIPPIPKEEWGPDMVEALGAFQPPRFRLPKYQGERRPWAWQPMEIFAHNVELMRAFLGLNGHVLWGTTLTARARHILILRVVARRRGAYGWGEHVAQGRDAGLSDDEIRHLASSIPSFADPIETALITATDEIVDAGAISLETWSVLAASFGPDQLLDIIFTVGCYQTVTAFARSVELEVHPDMAHLPDEEPTP